MLYLEGFFDFFKKDKKKYLETSKEAILDRFTEIEDKGYLIKTDSRSIGNDKLGFLQLSFIYNKVDEYEPIDSINNRKIIELYNDTDLTKIIEDIKRLYNVIVSEPLLYSSKNIQNGFKKTNIKEINLILKNAKGFDENTIRSTLGVVVLTINIAEKKQPYYALFNSEITPFNTLSIPPDED